MPFDFSTVPARFAALDSLDAGRPRGEALEVLVAEMFSAIPGVKIAKTKAVSGSKDAEFDILLANEALDNGLPDFGRDVLVECKSSGQALAARDITHFLHQAEIRKSKWSLLVSLAGITGNQEDWLSAHQIVRDFIGRDVWVLVLVRSELEAILSAAHLVAVIERKRQDLHVSLRVGTLSANEIQELAPRRAGVRVETGMEAFQRAVARMNDQAVNEVLARAVASGAGPPRAHVAEAAHIEKAWSAPKAVDQELRRRGSEPEPDPFMRDVYDRIVDMGAAVANILDEDFADEEDVPFGVEFR